MNRRDFLKAVGLTALAPVIARLAPKRCARKEEGSYTGDGNAKWTEIDCGFQPDAVIVIPDGGLWVRAFDGDNWGLYQLACTDLTHF